MIWKYLSIRSVANLTKSLSNTLNLGNKLGRAALINSDGQEGELLARNGTPVNPVAAVGVLAVDGVLTHAEICTIGENIYEINASDGSTVTTAGNIPVDITSTAIKAQGVATVSGLPTPTDVLEVGGVSYTFVADGTAAADGEVDVGANEADLIANVIAAINGTDGIQAAANPYVTATNGTVAETILLTAIIGGVAGNSIEFDCDDVTNMADDAAKVLGGETAGVDSTQDESGTALAAALTGDVSGTYDATANEITVTAVTKGVAGNSLDFLAGTMDVTPDTEGGTDALGGSVLGVDGTPALRGATMENGERFYVCITEGTIATVEWAEVAGLRNLTVSQTAVAVAADELVIPITHEFVNKAIGADAEALTLADGTPGQELHIYCGTAGGGTATLTPATSTGWSTIAFSVLGDQARLRYVDDTIGWVVLGTAGNSAPVTVIT